MSTKKVFIITTTGVLIIVAALIVVLLASFPNRDSEAVLLPETTVSTERPGGAGTDALDRVEVTRYTIREVVATLSRPESYSRDVTIESFWDGGSAIISIRVTVTGGMTSLRMQPSAGAEKRIIVTQDTLYIWHRGDTEPFVGGIDEAGDGRRTADEWQMIVTYEDILSLDTDDILDTGYVIFEGEDSVFAVYRSPLLGNTRTYFISLDLGLVVAAVEYDSEGRLIYRMTAGEATIGEVDRAAFTLPDGTSLLTRAAARKWLVSNI